MPTFEVVSGDTVWGLTRRALTSQLGRTPTNREILDVVNRVQTPSGSVDLIRPGEQIVIPVGPGYEDGAGDTPPAAGSAPGDFISNRPPSTPAPGYNRVPPAANAPEGGRPDDWRNPYRPSGSPGGAVNAPAGGRMSESEIARAAGEAFIDPYAAYRSQIRPAPLGLTDEASVRALGGLTAAALGGYGYGALARAVGAPAWATGAGSPAGGGAAAARVPFPTQASVAASRNPLPVSTSFRTPPPAVRFGAAERAAMMGPGGYAY